MTSPDEMVKEALKLPIIPSQGCMNCEHFVDDCSHLTVTNRFRCSAHGFRACAECNPDADCSLWRFREGEGRKINEDNRYGSTWKSDKEVSTPVSVSPSARRSLFDLIFIAFIAAILTALLLRVI
jgi:hypothetical protein